MADRHHNHRHRVQRPRSSKHGHQQHPQPRRPTTPPSPDRAIFNGEGSEASYWLGLSCQEGTTPPNDNLSFVDVGTNTSSVGTKDTGSFVLVDGVGVGERKRTYSNETVEEGTSDGKCYSTPSEGDGREWVVSTAAENEVVIDDVPRSQADALQGLSTPYPQQVYDGYEDSTVSTSDEDVEYQESMNCYTLNANSQPGSYAMEPDQSVPRTFMLTSRPYAQGFSESPWNPVEANRTPSFDHGYVAFMPSPGPVGRQTAEEILHGSPKSPRAPKVNRRSDQRSYTHSQSPSSNQSSKRKERESENGWEHVVVRKNGLGKLGSEQEERRSGLARRKGNLDPETRKKARKMRQIKSCWRCWNLKITCSEGEHCTPCLKRYSSPSPTSDQLCCRAGFDEYEPAFFPELLNAHLKKSQVEDLISKNTSGFWDVALDVEVTTGACFEPMTLAANFFGPKGSELLTHHHLATDSQDSGFQLLSRYSAPVGLLGIDKSDLTQKCRQYIQGMIEIPEYQLQATAGDATEVPRKILEIVQRYYTSKKSDLVRKAMMLHAINYSMSRLVTFSPESATRIAETSQLNNYIPPNEPFLSSRLLNRQIKYCLHRLHRETTKDVLEMLEKSMRSKSKDSWGPSLCAILILSLCIENLQIAADTFVVCDMQTNAASQYSRNDSFAACESLEEYPYQRCTKLFHDIYRTHKQASGKTKDGAFNPIQSTYKIDTSAGWDVYTNTMALAVRDLIAVSYPELTCLSERPQFVDLGSADLISTNNTGRLASKFLLSFL